MNENQRKWLQKLQEKGVEFEFQHSDGVWLLNDFLTVDSYNIIDRSRIPAQPIPDIPDWREVCRDMQSKGVEFENLCFDGHWTKGKFNFPDFVPLTHYRIPTQPIPEWREEMSESKEQSKPEVPHRGRQIQWHEEYLHHLKTGEPMWEWEYKNEAGYWHKIAYPSWLLRYEYRRKPRMKKVTYWHCVMTYKDDKGYQLNQLIHAYSESQIHADIRWQKTRKVVVSFSPITETIVEIPED